jgi:hypothetical protein
MPAPDSAGAPPPNTAAAPLRSCSFHAVVRAEYTSHRTRCQLGDCAFVRSAYRTTLAVKSAPLLRPRVLAMGSR